jgi:hypothetical protein
LYEIKVKDKNGSLTALDLNSGTKVLSNEKLIPLNELALPGFEWVNHCLKPLF